VDNHNHQEFLGVDVGAVRIGIARGNLAARLAEPIKTAPAGQAVAELLNLSNKNQATGIVVGLPRSLDGTETEQTKSVRQWVRAAKTQIRLPFYWQDEALTSRAATSKMQNVKSNIDEHSLAAAIILQDFLDTPESDRLAA
jgi:putative holliday junction resolvase